MHNLTSLLELELQLLEELVLTTTNTCKNKSILPVSISIKVSNSVGEKRDIEGVITSSFRVQTLKTNVTTNLLARANRIKWTYSIIAQQNLNKPLLFYYLVQSVVKQRLFWHYSLVAYQNFKKPLFSAIDSTFRREDPIWSLAHNFLTDQLSPDKK